MSPDSSSISISSDLFELTPDLLIRFDSFILASVQFEIVRLCTAETGGEMTCRKVTVTNVNNNMAAAMFDLTVGQRRSSEGCIFLAVGISN